MEKRILVTGATGNIGVEVVAHLHAAGVPVRALSRSPHATFPSGVDVACGDLSAPETLEAALTCRTHRLPVGADSNEPPKN